MAIDRWFIGGGAEHSPESARRLVYASTSGAEGVGSPTDLRVLPLEVPGQGIRVVNGSALIRSNYTGGETQTYMGTVYEQETVSVDATGSSAARSDLVVMRVEDPFAGGTKYPKPADEDIPDAPYIHIRVISGVPAGTRRLQDVALYRNDSAVTLARIDFPVNTGTVTAGMITDLREVAQPHRSEVVFARPRLAGDDSQMYLKALTSAGGEIFPGGAGIPNQFSVRVPEWATHMVIDAAWMSVVGVGNPYGSYWVEFGDEYRNHTWPNKQQYEFTTQVFGFNYPNSTDNSSYTWQLMDEVPIAAKLRGKVVTFAFKGGLGKTFPAASKVWMPSNGGLGCRLTFAERAAGADMV